jgi:hypothetical protein
MLHNIIDHRQFAISMKPLRYLMQQIGGTCYGGSSLEGIQQSKEINGGRRHHFGGRHFQNVSAKKFSNCERDYVNFDTINVGIVAKH